MQSRIQITCFTLLLLIPVLLFGQIPVFQANQYSFINGPGLYAPLAIPYSPIANPDPTAAMWTNPAGIGIDGSSGLLFISTGGSGGNTDHNFDDWGIGVNLEEIAYGVQIVRGEYDAKWHTIAGGIELHEGINVGYAYHWSSGLDRGNAWDAGLLVRPNEYMSVGLHCTNINTPRMTVTDQTGNDMEIELDPTYRAGLALRPFRDRNLTLSADMVFNKLEGSDYFEDIETIIMANFEPVNGIGIRAGYALEAEMAMAGLSIYGGFSELAGLAGFPDDALEGMPEAGGVVSARITTNYRPDIFARGGRKYVWYELPETIVEQPMSFSFFRPRYPTLYEVLTNLNRICQDDEIGGVILDITNLKMRFSDRYELRNALAEIRAAGKQVIVYSDEYHMGSIYLGSIADHVIINPGGYVEIPGYFAYQPYLRGLLDRLGIEAQVVQHGQYKSAGEILMRTDASEAAEEAWDTYIEDLWQEWLVSVADGRDVSQAEVEEWVDGAMYTPAEAMEMGIIDQIAYKDEVRVITETIAGFSPRILSSAYYFNREDQPDRWDNLSTHKIAIVYGVGNILPGESGNSVLGEVMGSETVAGALRAARNNSDIDAIVFRVDSGGGSSLASEIIRREIDRTNGEDSERRIPVVVSMSDVAGSGGYWIACTADQIVAPPTCVTGSIGVIGLKLVFSEMYDSLGISFDGVQRGRNSNIWSTDIRWNEEQENLMKHQMAATYDDFLNLVSRGRDLDTSRVNELGQGRIWSGVDALDNGLVDVNGGLMDAIRIAEDLAGISSDDIVEYVTYPNAGWRGPVGEIRAAVYDMLPPAAIRILQAEQFRAQLDESNIMLLTPADPDFLLE